MAIQKNGSADQEQNRFFTYYSENTLIPLTMFQMKK